MKRFTICAQQSDLFGNRIFPNTIFGEYTQYLGSNKTAVKYVWVVRDYTHVPMRFEILKRGAKSWQYVTLPDSSKPALNGLFGYVVRMIDKLDLYDVSAARDYTGIKSALPKERRAQLHEKSVYQAVGRALFNPNEGCDKHAYDNTFGTIRPDFMSDKKRAQYVSAHNGQSTYVSEQHKYDIELDKVTYVMHDGSKYYYRD